MKRSDDERRRIVLVQTIVPDYRARFFTELGSRLGPQLTLVAGREDWDPSVRPTGEIAHQDVRNVFLARRRLLWQVGAVMPVLRADVAVLSLNPRIVSNWVGLIGRRLARRRTVVWGHAWPRRGRSSRTDRLRSVMRRLAHAVIVYTQTEADELKATSPRIDVVPAPNALYGRSELGPAYPPEGRATDIVCVGRLTESKRPMLLLRAFEEAVEALPSDVRLVFVGDGPLRATLESRVERSGLGERVVFTGHLSGLCELRTVYSTAIASVAPGEAGLSLTQSLGFGVPMILSWLSGHGPEIEAAEDGVNVISFRAGSWQSLAAAIVETVAARDSWLSRRESIAASARERYSVESMADAFVRTLRVETLKPR